MSIPKFKVPYFKLGFVGITVLLAWLIWLDANLQQALAGRMWAEPAKVYARPLQLYDGASISLSDLKRELAMLGYRTVASPQRPGQVKFGTTTQIYTRGFQFADGAESPRRLSFSVIDDRVHGLQTDDGIGLARLDPLLIGSVSPGHSEDRLLVSLEQVPKPLQQLLVASEDRAFYEHHGISLRGILRAAWANLQQRRLAQGGSTLTQQLIKNYFLNAERTLRRKLIEIPMAMLLELRLDKSVILESYINEIYLAQDGPRAIHGFGLASQFFFEKDVAELALHEQALLVALVRGPSYYSPYRNPERARERRNLMLSLAAEQGFINQAQAKAAMAQPISVVVGAKRKSQRMPAYLDYVKRELRNEYSDQDLRDAGLNVFTHFDPIVQRATEGSIQTAASLNGDAALQAAAVMVRPQSGQVVAIVGDKNPRYPGFNRALDARRQVGSVIKPAVYLTALQQPEVYNLLSPLTDDVVEWPLSDGSVWSPENFDGESHGEVPLYTALARSFNQATAALGMALGVDSVVETLQLLGVEGDLPRYPSVLLGAAELAPIDVAQMYQTLAGGGFYADLTSIATVTNRAGELLSRNPLLLERRIDTASASMLQFALNRVTIDGSGRSLSWRLPQRIVAGKTGTSSELRDSWFAGFSGDLVGVVWLGRDDNSATPLTGAGGALPIWANIFKKVAREDLTLSSDVDLTYLGYNPKTQDIYAEGCAAPIVLPFNDDYAPKVTQRCSPANVIEDIKSRILEWLLK